MLEWVKRLAGIVRYEPPRPGAERRRAARVKAPMRMEVCFLEGPREDFGDGRVRDISTGGMLLESDVRPALGSPVVLMLHFPKSFGPEPPLKLRAKIVQNPKDDGGRSYRVACAFTGLNEESLRLLESFVRWLSGRAS